MRLIDADALIEAIDKMEKGSFYLPLLFRDMVKLQPTAYDVEKVEQQIDNLEIYFSDDCNDALVVLDDVMECVWNGGKE